MAELYDYRYRMAKRAYARHKLPLGRNRILGGKTHRLSSHSLSNEKAKRLAIRHRKLGMNAKVVQHGVKGAGLYAVYRACASRSPPNAKPHLKRIHVNQHMLRANRKNPKSTPQPPLTIQTSLGSIRASTVKIDGASELRYEPENPLSCGAHIWIETMEPVLLDNCAKVI